MSVHHNINYVEFPSNNLAVTKVFFSQVFNWTFIDYGPEYTAFNQQGIAGGFYLSDLTCSTKTGSSLVVIYSDDIDSTERNIVEAGGKIIVKIFEFPGGKRFHFCDPIGNEYAVWTK